MADDPTFASIEEIDKHYGRAIKAAGDDEPKVRELQIEQREARADFRDRQATARELSAHRIQAIAKAGIPDDFQDFVTGSTPEEIDASATKVKERIEKLTKQQTDDDEGARRTYGPPANGGGTPPGARSSEDEQFIADFQGRFNDPTATMSIPEIQRYGRLLGGAQLLHNMAKYSKAFERAGVTPEVVAQHEAGKLKQTRPSRTVQAPPRS